MSKEVRHAGVHIVVGEEVRCSAAGGGAEVALGISAGDLG